MPHENLAVAMAHGAYAMTGRPQAVMVHVNVGTGNTINNLINLSRDRVPLILAAGRTPITEKGRFGSRSRQIHWGQEMFDQAGMVREIVKWDYELRMPEQVADVVARAHEVAMTSPRGPVYLVLPREPLSAPRARGARSRAARSRPPRRIPIRRRSSSSRTGSRRRRTRSSSRRRPARTRVRSRALARLAERAAIPVVCHNARNVCLPSSHPMHAGFDSGPLVGDADLIIVIESDAPWYPNMQSPPAGCRVAHIGEDPAFVRHPMRSFPSDLSITAAPATALEALDAAVAKRDRRCRRAPRESSPPVTTPAAPRRRRKPPPNQLSLATFSRAIGDAVGEDAVIFNEYPLSLDHCPREKPDTYFGVSAAGGLGWGLGAALGAKLAAPDKLVVATLGDGAYMFANPTVGHWVGAKFDLPVLTVDLQQQSVTTRCAARRSRCSRTAPPERTAATSLPTSPPRRHSRSSCARRAATASASIASKTLPRALARARDAVTRERRQALVNVICPN